MNGLADAPIDLVIEGGRVFDGLGAPAAPADVAILSGRIAAIGDLRATPRNATLDAEGLAVAPGFIDIHSHSDISLLADPRAESGLLQGVTTEIVGNCGHGPAPISDTPPFRANLYGSLPGLALDWDGMAGYIGRLREARPAVNVGVLVPNGNLRLSVLGPGPTTASAGQRRRMVDLLERSLDEGGLGLSTGLEYPLEAGTSVADVTALCAAVARCGGLHATHTRARGEGILEATDEALAVARETGVRTQVAHALPRLEAGEGAAAQVVGLLERAAAELDLGWDMHTRTFAGAGLGSVLPPVAIGAGADVGVLAASVRAAIDDGEGLVASFARAGWDRVSIAGDQALAGRSLATLAAAAGSDPVELLARIWLDAGRDRDRLMVHAKVYEERGIAMIAASSKGMLASDAASQSRGGPYDGVILDGAFTWAAWMLRRLVRETAVLELRDAIRRLTSLPAERAGLRDRGRIEVGARADLSVFDPAIISEKATPEDPLRPAVGVRHVIVNGGRAVEDGRLTGVRAGQVLSSRGDAA